MTAKQKKKQKELLNKLHAKYYGKKKSKAKEAKPQESSAVETGTKAPSRHELMLQAKERGIKNFRVINKEELVEILKEGTTQERINEIVSGAVTRWKAGWGKGKKQKTQA
jgi:predicted amidophosphoribosyltransferase